MKLVPHLKFHGEEISSSDSKKKIGIASHSVFEIRAVVDDVRANALRGMSLFFLDFRISGIY